MINHAFDFETVLGNAVVIGYSDGTYIEFPTLDEILERFTSDPKKNRWWSYNLRFDADCFLKMLPYDNIAELMADKDTIYKHWKLHILGGSNVAIRDLNQTGQVKLWDMAQFMKYLKLSVAAERYLSESEYKMDSDVINTFVDSKHGDNTVGYYKKHHDEVNEYCVNDARITKLLADYFQKTCLKEQYNFAQPYSLGNMSIKWFRSFLNNRDYKYGQIPRIHPTFWKQENPERRMIENVMDKLSRGGWNDAFQRGRFEKAWDYDIISAYPTIMRDIPYWDGNWVKVTNGDQIGDAEYGFLFAEIKNLSEPLLPEVYYYFDESFYQGHPIKWVNNSVLHCTVSKSPIITTLTIDQWRYLKERADVLVFEGMVLRPKYDYFPLKDPINELIKRKFKAKEDKGRESPEYWIAKTMMNSTSGKFKQKWHTDRTWFFYPHVYGKITWKTKEIMVDLITENDAWDKIISVSTDGGIFTGKLNNVDLSGNLGSFEVNLYEEFVQIGNGIYYGKTAEGELKQRMRGFRITKKGMDLPQLIESNPKVDRFEFPTFRPLHLRECFVHNKILKISDTNRFVPITRHLNINKEIKRQWFDKFQNVEDMLSGRIIKSKAWEIKTARQLSKKAEIKLRKELEAEDRQWEK